MVTDETDDSFTLCRQRIRFIRSAFDRSFSYHSTTKPLAIPLIFLIGLPGSGKSSLAEALLQTCSQRCLIATDAIRANLFGDEAIQGPWLLIWRAVGKQFQQAAQHIAAGQAVDAIYDATNVVCRDRRRAIALARAYGFTDITGIWVNTPLDLCLQRNRQRDRQVPEAIILRMYQRLMEAPPVVEDGCDRVIEVREEG